MLDVYLQRWNLTPDGPVVVTPSSHVLPVRHRGRPAMLKWAVVDEERAGGALMAWWGGRGAALVLAHDAEAVLLERAQGTASLAAIASTGQDDAASRILCRVLADLHAPRSLPPPALVPLEVWFGDLVTAAQSHGGILAAAADVARGLVAAPREVGVLHGDMHHDNVLDFGAKGWLAIDPKGLLGERGYDYANLFRNPNAQVAAGPGRFDRQTALVAQEAGLERERLLRWILAVMGLSACWPPAHAARTDVTLRIAAMAAAALER